VASISVELNYAGYVARLAGRAAERLELPGGSTLDDVLRHVIARCQLNPGQARQLYLRVEGETRTALADGDRVLVSVLIGGG
jgi:molybdopterin converting factor small subunit